MFTFDPQKNELQVSGRGVVLLFVDNQPNTLEVPRTATQTNLSIISYV